MPADDDALERAARRETEIADRLARGRLSSAQAEQLRDLLGSPDRPERTAETHRRELDPSQLRKVLDEGLDPDVLALALSSLRRLSTDEVIDLLVEFSPEEDFFTGLDRGDLAQLDRATAVTLLEHSVDPADLTRLRRAGQPLSASDAARLCEAGADLSELAVMAEQIGEWGLRLTCDQMARLSSEGVDLEQVGRLMDLGLGLDQAVELAAGDVDPDVLRRLLDEGVDIDWAQLARPRPPSGWAGTVIGFKGRHRQVGLILGDHVVVADATLTGAVLGSVTVRPGARVTIDALVTGDVVVQAHGSVRIRGTVRGRVRNRGGAVEITGAVRGGIVEEMEEVV